MDFVNQYWIHAVLFIVGILIGRMWGKQSMMEELAYQEQVRQQQEVFSQYIRRGNHEE